MGSRTFFIVDVFAEQKYAGNQLAVFPEGDRYTDEEMKLLARETNFSEVTFIMPGRSGEGGFNVRIFSLDEELPFAGHPTLGTAYIIQRHFIEEEVPQVILNLPVGPIPVAITYHGGEPETLFMRQAQPSFGEIINPAAVAEVLNIDTSEIDARYPVQEVSTGLPFIIVPLKSLQVQRGIRVNIERFISLVETVEAKSIYVFCPEAYSPENDFNARMFDYYNGIPEDPATGSAAGCLAAYLLKYRFFDTARIDLRVEQGMEIKRPSLLQIRASERGGQMEISVGGGVIPVAEGRLL